MLRVHTPEDIAAAPPESQPALEAVERQLGLVPNLFRVVSDSAALEGCLGRRGTFAKGSTPATRGERIVFAIAEISGRDYWPSAHTYLGRNLAKLDDAEVSASRSGASDGAKVDAGVTGVCVALNTWTTGTDIDFPLVGARAAA
jgi:hypothetical protein